MTLTAWASASRRDAGRDVLEGLLGAELTALNAG